MNYIRPRTVSRRLLLKGLAAATQSRVWIGLPPLAAMFNSHGTAFATEREIPNRFVLWFNGNGITEKYWIPAETGPDYVLSPCLAPLAPLKNHFHVITG